MKTLVLSIDDIRQMVQEIGIDALMDEMIHTLTDAFITYDPEKTTIPMRDGFNYNQPYIGLIEWMPVMENGKEATVKMVGYHPTNPLMRHLPTILSTISAYDTTTGHLIGLADATFLTALRTGAASAIASKMMALPDSKTIGLIGNGAQAVTQLHALSRCFNIETVYAYDVAPVAAESLAKRTAFLNLNIQVAPLEKLVSESDIICTATSVDIGDGPVFEAKNIKPWLHVNAVGADFPGKVEVPEELLKRSFVSPDFLAQALKEGECQRLSIGDIGPQLVEIVQNSHDYEFVKKQLSVFDSTGWALEDQVGLGMLLKYAAELNLGKEIEIESISDDPRDPYQFINVGQTKNIESPEKVAVVEV